MTTHQAPRSIRNFVIISVVVVCWTTLQNGMLESPNSVQQNNKFVISFHIVIEHFLDRLPASVPYDILRFRTMETINDVAVDDVTAFIKLTDGVIKIDNTYRRTSNSRSSACPSNPTSCPSVPQAPSSSNNVSAKPSSSQAL